MRLTTFFSLQLLEHLKEKITLLIAASDFQVQSEDGLSTTQDSSKYNFSYLISERIM